MLESEHRKEMIHLVGGQFHKFVTMPLRGSHSYPSLFAKDFDISCAIDVGVQKPASVEQKNRNQTIRKLRAQGLSYPAVAIQMKLSVGAVRNVVNRRENT